MLQNLSNTNGSGTSSAVTNKKISDLENAVSEINTCLDELNTDVSTATADIAAIKTCVANGVFEDNVSGNVVQTREKLVTDVISGNTSDTITIEDDICGQNATFNSVTAATISDAGGNTLSSVSETVVRAKAIAEDAVHGVVSLAAVVDADKLDLANYKQAISQCVATSCVDATNIRASSVVSNSSCTTCLVANDAAIARLETEASTFGGILEPTSKDEEEYYEVILPANFSGKASFVGVDSNDKVLFSATIDNAIANTDLQDREGTALVIHSGITKYDFYQVLRKRSTDVISFITKSNVSKIFWQYSNYDKTEEPTYIIYSNLTDNGPDYDSYSTVYTAEHSDQVIVLGSESTLNGGLTILGTFQATAFEAPESEVTNVYVKNQIHGGYECDTGEYTTCGTLGGIITYNERESSGECNVSWINGEPRQVVRKGTAKNVGTGLGNTISDGNTPPIAGPISDGTTSDTTESDLTFETVKTCDDTTGTFKPSMTDCLFDERGLATYEGVTSDYRYPIKHLNANACAHGDLRVEGEAIVDKDVSVKGNLYVAGTVVTTEETQVATSGDYVVTRLNNPITMSSTDYSGLAVNISQNRLATITADCSGEWRVADSSTASATNYTNIHNFNNAWYSGLNQNNPITVAAGVIKASVSDELSNTVYYNGEYYHQNGGKWYQVQVAIPAKVIDLGPEITNETTIAALAALDKHTLEFYFELTVTTIDSSVNQPILTRSEKSTLCNNDILLWDATNNCATNATRPTSNGQVLVSGSSGPAWTSSPTFGTVTATSFVGPLSGTATNATCFNGCTYAQAKADIRSGLTSCTGTVTSVNVSVNGVSGTAVTTSGTVTLTNVPPYFANGTLYAVGDDICIGDVNQAGMLGIRSQNSTTMTGIKFIQCSGTASGCLYACATNNCLYYNGAKLGSGSVTSVNVSVNGVSGTAVTGSGTITLSNVCPYVGTSATSGCCPLVFTTSVTAGVKAIQTGTVNSLWYNPSTNALCTKALLAGTVCAPGVYYNSTCQYTKCVTVNGATCYSDANGNVNLGNIGVTPSIWQDKGYPKAGIVVYNADCGLMYDSSCCIGLETDQGILYATETQTCYVTTKQLYVAGENTNNVNIEMKGCQHTIIGQRGYVTGGPGYFSYIRSGVEQCVVYKELVAGCNSTTMAFGGLTQCTYYSAMGTYNGQLIIGFCFNTQVPDRKITLYTRPSPTVNTICTYVINASGSTFIGSLHLVAPGNQQ